MNVMKFLAIIEKTATGFSAYSPDLPGCVATGATLEAASENMKSAIDFHVEGLREDGQEIPAPSSTATYIETAA